MSAVCAKSTSGLRSTSAAQRHRGEVVGAHVLERALGRAPDRRADRVDDDGVGHGSVSFFDHGAVEATTVGSADAPPPRPGRRPARPHRRPARAVRGRPRAHRPEDGRADPAAADDARRVRGLLPDRLRPRAELGPRARRRARLRRGDRVLHRVVLGPARRDAVGPAADRARARPGRALQAAELRRRRARRRRSSGRSAARRSAIEAKVGTQATERRVLKRMANSAIRKGPR